MKYKIVLVLLTPALIWGATQASKLRPKTNKTASHQSSSAAGKGKRTKRGKAVARKAAGPSYQTHPSEDRYKDIQQALAEKGYFKGDVNGEWKDDSVDALKRFQGEHQLSNDGKITAPSLLQLGLGPNHENRNTTGSATGAQPDLLAPAPSAP